MTPLRLVSVPFQGDMIDAGQTDDGTILVSPIRICDSLGIRWGSQYNRLKNHTWATIFDLEMVAKDGRIRRVAMIPLKIVPMWLAQIQIGKIKVGMRAKLLAYQLEAAEVLSAWFLGVSDVPGLAGELADVKGRLATALAQAATANTQTATALEQTNNYRTLTDMMLNPLAPSVADDGNGARHLWLPLRVFVSLVGICNIAGAPMTTNSLKSAGHALSKLSRLFGIDIHTTEGRMPVAAYRLDVLQTWHAMTTVGVKVPATLYKQLVSSKLIV